MNKFLGNYLYWEKRKNYLFQIVLWSCPWKELRWSQFFLKIKYTVASLKWMNKHITVSYALVHLWSNCRSLFMDIFSFILISSSDSWNNDPSAIFHTVYLIRIFLEKNKRTWRNNNYYGLNNTTLPVVPVL